MTLDSGREFGLQGPFYQGMLVWFHLPQGTLCASKPLLREKNKWCPTVSNRGPRHSPDQAQLCHQFWVRPAGHHHVYHWLDDFCGWHLGVCYVFSWKPFYDFQLWGILYTTLMEGRVVETVSRPLTNISPHAKNESLSAQRFYEMVSKCLSVIVCARAKSYKSPPSMQTYKVNKQ